MKPLLYPLALAAFALAASCATAIETERRIAVTAETVALAENDPAITTAGRLAYRGGLALKSRDRRFGGLSGLRWLPAYGGFLAITDRGDWLRFDTREDDGRLIGLANVRLGPLLAPDGAPFLTKVDGDAEALTVNGNRALIAFEQRHRILSYELDETGAPTRPASVFDAEAPLFARQPANGGIEAMADGAGELILLSEAERRPNGEAALYRRPVHRDGEGDFDAAGLALAGDFSPTDADRLESGAYLVLARAFSPLKGVAATILHVEMSDGGIRTSPLAELRPPLTLDNMEGLAVREENGRTMLYLLSDDNFSVLQRTLLMKFELVAG